MKLPQNKRDKPGSISKAMDKALGVVQPELPNIFNVVKSVIELNKAYRKLNSSKIIINRIKIIKEDLDQLIKDLYEYHKVDKDIVEKFNGLIKQESSNPQ